MRITDIEPLSICALLIRPMFNDVEASPAATGFIVSGCNGPRLVTARHVVTGKHQDTGNPLNESSGCLPNKLIIRIPIVDVLGSVSFQIVELPLWPDGQPDSANERPLWHEHPRLGSSADIVAINLPVRERDQRKLAINSGKTGTANFESTMEERQIFAVTTKVYVLGFPFAREGPSNTAIWTSGSVASEFGDNSVPYTLVDARTRNGQSGAPVIMYDRSGNIRPDGGMTITGQPAYVLVGLYSGRINKDADIGKVWKRQTLLELVEQN